MAKKLRRVLVVDDEPQILSLFARILCGRTDLNDAFALSCHLINSAVELEQFFAEQPPVDLAFLDVGLWASQIDGFAVAQRLWQQYPTLQVVFCSGSSKVTFAEMGRRLGSSDRYLFLKKPFEAIEVQQVATHIHHRLLAQEKLTELLADLEQQVSHRTQDLREAHEQLQAEVTSRKLIEVELRHAQKIEAVGQMASGIAHEINTPVQYIGNNLEFLRQSFSDLSALLTAWQERGTDFLPREVIEELRELETATDLRFLQENVPSALHNANVGVERVSEIVRAMRAFGHPGGQDKAPADINQAVADTLVVGRAEYKQVARVETRLGLLPPVLCHIGDVNRVLLNLVINAAHAIATANENKDVEGIITIRTFVSGDHVQIDVADTGCGIDPKIKHRVFDPFFTTKPPGKGTGQGLSIAHSVVVQGHEGTLTFDSEVGEGTVFHVRLPIDIPRTGVSTQPGIA